MYQSTRNRYEFPKRNRILLRRDFQSILKGGLKVVNRSLVMVARKNADGNSRLGIIVSKKVGNAIVRNRVKRQLREAFRARKATDRHFDLIIIARRSVVSLGHLGFHDSFNHCLGLLLRKC